MPPNLKKTPKRGLQNNQYFFLLKVHSLGISGKILTIETEYEYNPTSLFIVTVSQVSYEYNSRVLFVRGMYFQGVFKRYII